MAKKKTLGFSTAFMFPFNRAKGLWNILWVFLPIIGWFALGGYCIRIVKGFIKGKVKELPTFSFKSDLKFGFMMFLKAIPFILVYAIIIGLLSLIPWLRIIDIFMRIFILPILFLNFFKKETIASLFEFSILSYVFNNFWDYVIALLKEILLAIIFIMMYLVLVGIPAGAFTKYIFLADFYRRHVK